MRLTTVSRISRTASRWAGAGTIDSVAGYNLQCQDGDQNFNTDADRFHLAHPAIIASVQPTNSTCFVNPAKKISLRWIPQASTVNGANVTLSAERRWRKRWRSIPAVATRQLWATNTTPAGDECHLQRHHHRHRCEWQFP